MTVRRIERREMNAASPLQIYLHDINDTPLLSAEEERELAERVAMGDPHAREHMVKANLRLVVNIARGYLGKGLSLEDLIEEGNLGLMRAVEGFDGMMDTRFSTYASYWIKQSIRRAVMNNGKPIRLPAYMVSLLSKWKRAQTVLAERLGRAPTHDEIGKALRLSKRKIGIVAKAIRVNDLSPHSETPSDEGPALDDVLTDDRSKAPEVQLIESDDLDRIFVHIGELDDREATVIRMRFGLDSYDPMTLREVGENLGLTRERVRQLENQALQKLIGALREVDSHAPIAANRAIQSETQTEPKRGSTSTGASSSASVRHRKPKEPIIEVGDVSSPSRGSGLEGTPPSHMFGRPDAGSRRASLERRRRIDPTTFERQYTDDEMELMNAMNEYKRRSGRMFPTWSEVLEVFSGLGYRRAVFEFDADFRRGTRRFVDLRTSDERDYKEAEMEFMNAVNEYKRRSGRMFPTWSEILEVLQSLGYEKIGISSIQGEDGRSRRPVVEPGENAHGLISTGG